MTEYLFNIVQSISASSSGGVCDGHLMPAQQVLSDVRKEREVCCN